MEQVPAEELEIIIVVKTCAARMGCSMVDRRTTPVVAGSSTDGNDTDPAPEK